MIRVSGKDALRKVSLFRDWLRAEAGKPAS